MKYVYYANSAEDDYLMHAVTLRGSERKNHKYVARVGEYPKYKYFYTNEEYQAYLRGGKRTLNKNNISSKLNSLKSKVSTAVKSAVSTANTIAATGKTSVSSAKSAASSTSSKYMKIATTKLSSIKSDGTSVKEKVTAKVNETKAKATSAAKTVSKNAEDTAKEVQKKVSSTAKKVADKTDSLPTKKVEESTAKSKTVSKSAKTADDQKRVNSARKATQEAEEYRTKIINEWKSMSKEEQKNNQESYWKKLDNASAELIKAQGNELLAKQNYSSDTVKELEYIINDLEEVGTDDAKQYAESFNEIKGMISEDLKKRK